MNTYTDNNVPKGGNAKKIFDALNRNGFTVIDLHYNPNCWGNSTGDGWGTWSCRIRSDKSPRDWGDIGIHCGLLDDGRAYLQTIDGQPRTFILE